MTRVVFLGTPPAAVPTLELLDAGFEVGLVVTRPDRPKGRSGRPSPPPVKEIARGLGLAVAQPTSGGELRARLEESSPFDVGVVVAYGRILTSDVLAIPARGMVNVHFSLLPRWRGAAPVQRALMAGDEMTGVSIIRLDEGLDTGPVLTAQAIDIPAEDDAGSLSERLALIGARLLVAVLDDYVAGRVVPVTQSDDGVTYAEKIISDDRPLDVSGTVQQFVRKVRALAPEPAATLVIDGDVHKIFRAAPHEESPPQGTWVEHDGLPVIGTADGGVSLLALQPPGRRVQAGEDWIRGRRRPGGTIG